MGNEQSSTVRADPCPVEHLPKAPMPTASESSSGSGAVHRTRLRAMTQPTISTRQNEIAQQQQLQQQQSLPQPLTLDPPRNGPAVAIEPLPGGRKRASSHAPSPPSACHTTPLRRKPNNFTSVVSSPLSLSRFATTTTTMTAGGVTDSLESCGAFLSPPQRPSHPPAPPPLPHSPLMFSASRSPSIAVEGKDLSRMELLQLPPMATSAADDVTGGLPARLPFFARPDWSGSTPHACMQASGIGSSTQEMTNAAGAFARASLSGMETPTSEPSGRRPHSVTFCDEAVVMQSDDDDDVDNVAFGMTSGDSIHAPLSTCVPLQANLPHTLQIAKSKAPQKPLSDRKMLLHRQLL